MVTVTHAPRRSYRATPLYYYRELQNLRDPLHFHRGPTGVTVGNESLAGRRDAVGVKEK